MPRFSDDDVVDFLITEAVVLTGREAEAAAQEKAEEDAERQRFREEGWKNIPQGP